jgi:hypothetical protein
MPALGGEAVILFERYEQKDKSGSADPYPWRGNDPSKINKNVVSVYEMIKFLLIKPQ